MSESKKVQKIYYSTLNQMSDISEKSKVELMSKLLRHLKRDQREQALSMSGVGSCHCNDDRFHEHKICGWICGICGESI